MKKFRVLRSFSCNGFTARNGDILLVNGNELTLVYLDTKGESLEVATGRLLDDDSMEALKVKRIEEIV